MPTRIIKHILKITPDALAIRLVKRVVGQTKPLDLSKREKDAMALAKITKLGMNGEINAWEWGNGPIVVFVHGWGGQASQMAVHAQEISKRGYRCIVFDVTGHGDAPKNYTQWDYFIRDVTAFSKSLDDKIYAYVGHSAGAMTMMAAHHLGRIQAEKFICICAPSYPFPPIRALVRKLDPRNSVLSWYKKRIADQFEMSWSDLEKSEYYANPASHLLLVYDKKDRFVPHTEGDKIHSLCPKSTLVKTETYGHTRILVADELNIIVGDYLTAKNSATVTVSSN